MQKICFIGAGSTVFAKNVLGDCILKNIPLKQSVDEKALKIGLIHLFYIQKSSLITFLSLNINHLVHNFHYL